jgi:hypothetical protein
MNWNTFYDAMIYAPDGSTLILECIAILITLAYLFILVGEFIESQIILWNLKQYYKRNRL